MRYTIIFLVLFISGNTFAQNDAIDKYFDKYLDDENFTSVFISPKMFSLISKLDLDAVESEPEAKLVMDVVKDLKGLRVLSTEVNAQSLFKEFMGLIDENEYEMLMTVRDGGENIRFWVKDNGNIINELVLIAGAEKEVTILSFTGNIDLAKISALANQLDVKGAEHLDKIKSN